MDQARVKTARPSWGAFGIGGALVGAFLLAVVSWGGVVGGERLTLFWLGVATLIAALGAFTFAFWHLLVRPLPRQRQEVRAQAIRASYRQAIALLLGVASMALVPSLFWDEVWHRRYGIPFGEDFLWRPHMLMYFSFLAVAALGAAGLYIMLRQLRGSLQQRFRAAPTLGMLVLVAAFMVYGLVADPLWHAIYGEDLSALSIPHVVLLMNFTLTMLVAVAIERSLVPGRRWGPPAQASLHDLLPLLMFACILLINLQVLITDYDHADSFAAPAVRDRPEWVLPFLIATIAALTGALANHSLRYHGAATAAGLLALGLRYSLIQLFDAPEMGLGAWVMALPPLVALDLWHLACALRGRAPGWLGGGVAAGLGMVAAYPLLAERYPHVTITSVPLMAAMVLCATLGAGWLGAQIGDYLGSSNKQVEQAGMGRAGRLALLGTLVALGAFIVVFVRTATPPI